MSSTELIKVYNFYMGYFSILKCEERNVTVQFSVISAVNCQ